MNYLSLFLNTVLIDNVILVHFFGFCPLLGVTNKKKSASGMGLAVIFVIVGSSAITWSLYRYILRPLHLEYLELVTFILVIASFVQFIEMFLKRFVPALYKSLGIFLPLITTNCAVLYATMQNISQGYGFTATMVNALGISVGVFFVVYVFATLRERLNNKKLYRSFQGNPIALIIAALMALAFSGLAGLV